MRGPCRRRLQGRKPLLTRGTAAPLFRVAMSSQRTRGGEPTSSGAVCLWGGGECDSISILGTTGQGCHTPLVMQQYRAQPRDHLTPRPPQGSNPALHSPASFSEHKALPLEEGAAKAQARQTRSLQPRPRPPGLAAAGKSVLAPEGARRPLALPGCCCGAEITGTGRVGWREPPRSRVSRKQ